MNIMKKAFTLTELLVALAVIGVITAILIPIVYNIMPDQNTLMAKRAFYTTQSIVSELINDDACYPDKTRGLVGNNKTGSSRRLGFDDGFGYSGCELWGGTEATEEYINTEGNADDKFMTLFTSLVNLKGTSQTLSALGGPSGGSMKIGEDFETKDGLTWRILADSQHTFNKWTYATENIQPEDGYIHVIVDTNGDKEPNCGQAEESGQCEDLKNYDMFTMRVYVNGKIDILDEWAQEAVDINHEATGD